MIYKFVTSVIVLNLLYELLEMIFPSTKLKTTVKSFVLLLMIYTVCEMISNLL